MTTIPVVFLLFRTKPYLLAFTIVAIGILVDFMVYDPSIYGFCP
jgi:hypothetical protein